MNSGAGMCADEKRESGLEGLRVRRQANGVTFDRMSEVDDLDAELKRFRGKRCLPLGRPVPAAALKGRRIVFLLTPERDLIELVESNAAA